MFYFSKQQTKLKLMFSQILVPVNTSLKLLRFTGTIRKPGNKYCCKRNFQLNLAKHRAVITVSARCFHMILQGKFFYLSISSDVWNLLFNGSLNVFVTVPMMTQNRTKCDSVMSLYITAGYRIIWVGARLCKTERSHQHNKLSFLLRLTQQHVSTTYSSLPTITIIFNFMNFNCFNAQPYKFSET